MAEETESVAPESIPSNGEMDTQSGVDEVASSEVESTEEVKDTSDVPAEAGQTESQSKYGSFGDDPDKLWQGYRSLESKLGHGPEYFQELEAKAAAYEKIAPLLQSQPQPESTEPDFSQMTPEQIVDYRAEQKINEVMASRVDPFIQDYNNMKAEQAVQEVRNQFPDFDQYAPQIAQIIDRNPGMVPTKEALVTFYKALNYERAKETGAKEAYEKLRMKRKTSQERPVGGSVGGKKPTSIMEAFRMATSGDSN